MEIVNDDAMHWLQTLDDEIADFIFLDPDYNDWEELINKGLLQECIRVLKPSGNICAFTKQPFDYYLRTKVGQWFRREIVWTFENGGAWVSKRMPLVSTQKIYWLVKSKEFFFNPRTGIDYNDKTKDFKRTRKVFGGYDDEGRNFTKSEEGTWIRDHYHFNKPMTGAIPSKPRELVRILLRCFCVDGGLVLNPFAGSGIVESEAVRQGKDILSCELDEDRCFAIIDKLFKEVTEMI